jgi:hypothetical protein
MLKKNTYCSMMAIILLNEFNCLYFKKLAFEMLGDNPLHHDPLMQ